MSNHLSLKACLVGVAFSALTTASIGDGNHAGAVTAADTLPASSVPTVELERVVIRAKREATPLR
jgi:hypothetical protein